MDLGKLLRKVETAPNGTPILDRDFAKVFAFTPRKVSRSIDASTADRKRASGLVVDLRLLHTQ
jgi:hypothetical protein